MRDFLKNNLTLLNHKSPELCSLIKDVTNDNQYNIATSKSGISTLVRVFPNGNLEIKGQKKLRITEGTEYIRLSGIIRPQDISTTNSVSSAKIAEAQIEYVGAGILDSATKPGWGSKIFRAISPF